MLQMRPRSRYSVVETTPTFSTGKVGFAYTGMFLVLIAGAPW